jgi:hypothetical protein
MSGDDNLSAFLKGFGFDEEELTAVSDDIDFIKLERPHQHPVSGFLIVRSQTTSNKQS